MYHRQTAVFNYDLQQVHRAIGRGWAIRLFSVVAANQGNRKYPSRKSIFYRTWNLLGENQGTVKIFSGDED
jgi:hypothetical protein